MKKSLMSRDKSPHLGWLGTTREFRPPIDESHPVWVRHGVSHGAIAESHPCCEINIHFSGKARILAGGEERDRRPGEVLLFPTGMPHDLVILKPPVHFCTVFFLPSLLIQMAPGGVGRVLLQRILMRQPLASRMIGLPPKIHASVVRDFKTIMEESDAKAFGHEVRVRTLLLEILLQIHRWEMSRGKKVEGFMEDRHWSIICEAMAYLHAHFSEPIYAHDLAREVGASGSRLRAYFHDLLGTSVARCLARIRVENAVTLLSDPARPITDVAASSGFTTLSHFNSAFLQMMGCTPTEYRRRNGLLRSR